MSKLSKAVEKWLVLEFKFRHGKHMYTTRSQNDYVDAEDDIRKALTGSKDLVKAYNRLRREQKKRKKQ